MNTRALTFQFGKDQSVIYRNKRVFDVKVNCNGPYIQISHNIGLVKV